MTPSPAASGSPDALPPVSPRPAGFVRHPRAPRAPGASEAPEGATPPGSGPAAPPPVRLLAPHLASPFAPGREVTLARVHGALLEGLGVRHGDHVALERTDRAEHGDLAAVVDASGRAALWRVYPEGSRLRLSTGDPAVGRTTGPDPRVSGVVVGVLRKFPAYSASSKDRTTRGESERTIPLA